MAMGQLAGQRTYQQVEICHLIQNLPIVTCSHTAVNVNISNDTVQILPKSNEEDVLAIKINLMDAYANRQNANLWRDSKLFQKWSSSLVNMSFADFAITFYVGQRGEGRNKIQQHSKSKKKRVLLTFPKPRSLEEHFKHALIRHKPWTGSVETLWVLDSSTTNEYNDALHHEEEFHCEVMEEDAATEHAVPQEQQEDAATEHAVPQEQQEDAATEHAVPQEQQEDAAMPQQRVGSPDFRVLWDQFVQESHMNGTAHKLPIQYMAGVVRHANFTLQELGVMEDGLAVDHDHEHAKLAHPAQDPLLCQNADSSIVQLLDNDEFYDPEAST